MQETLLKSKVHRATVTECVDTGARNYNPRVVHVDARNDIQHIDREVATLGGANRRVRGDD